MTSPALGHRQRALHLARAYYFFYFGAIGAFVPYVNLYYQSIGLSDTAIGLLSAIGPVCLIAAGPLWGSLGDRFRIHRGLLPLATLGPIVPSLLIPTVRAVEWLAPLTVIMSLFSAAIGPLIDSATLDLIEGTAQSYGVIRLWGSFGFMLGTYAAGLLIQAYGYVWAFWAYALIMAAATLTAAGLPARRVTLRSSFREGLGRLLAQPAFSLFLMGGLLTGAAFYAALTFFPLRLASLGARPSLIGLSGVIAALSELPVLFFSRAVLKRLTAWGSATLGACLYAGRWALVALAGTPTAALLTQTLHSVSFGPFLIGGVAYVEEHTPAGLSATAQAVYTAAFYGVGAALGVISGGWLYGHLGPMPFFLAAAAVAGSGAGFVVAAGRAARATTL